ncbi:MAG: hypothetical protein ACLFUH_01040 [Bacteroidales bacterium]
MTEEKENKKKKWYYSKTMWANLIVLAALIIQNTYGIVLSPTEQIALLTVINILLRIATKEEIEWSLA